MIDLIWGAPCCKRPNSMRKAGLSTDPVPPADGKPLVFDGPICRSTSARGSASFVRPAADSFDFKKIFKAPNAALAAIAGCLHTAKRAASAAWLPVHFHHARTQAAADPVAPLTIRALYVVGEAIRRVIGDAECLFFILNGMIDRTGPKISSRAIVMSLLTSATRSAARNSHG